VISLSVQKKIIIVISAFLLIAGIILSIVQSVIIRIDTANDLYRDVSHTFGSVYKKINTFLADFKSVKSPSYTIDIVFDGVSSVPCSEISLSNNPSHKYFEVCLQNLKVNKTSTIDLSTFTANNEVGFYLDDNPRLYYTADGNKFRSDWNKSAYSKLVKIPDYVPENINYSKISSLISLENFGKLFLGMGLGREKVNLKELVSNLNVSSPQSYAAYRNGESFDAQIAHLTVSTDFLMSFVQKLKESSEKAEFGYINDILSHAEELLDSMTQKTVKIDFVICRDELLWMETSLELSSGLVNARLDINKNKVSFQVRKLHSTNSCLPDFSFEINYNSPEGLNLNISKKDKELFGMSLKKTVDSSVVSDITYYDKNSDSHKISANYFPESQKFRSDDIPAKNIYALTVSDLLKLYAKIDHRASGQLFSLVF